MKKPLKYAVPIRPTSKGVKPRGSARSGSKTPSKPFAVRSRATPVNKAKIGSKAFFRNRSPFVFSRRENRAFPGREFAANSPARNDASHHAIGYVLRMYRAKISGSRATKRSRTYEGAAVAGSATIPQSAPEV